MDRELLADRIIRDHTTYALAAGAIPIPLADVAAVAAVQLDLVRALANVYEVSFDPAAGKAVIAALAGASAARLGASVVKAVPGVGWIAGAVAQAGLAGASTYAVGHLFRGHFAREGTLGDVDLEAARPLFDELLRKGRDFVEGFRPSSQKTVEDVTELLERLARLREQNVIGESEFQELKRKILTSRRSSRRCQGS
jgi:uncharacterized protein (DUF697 family)